MYNLSETLAAKFIKKSNFNQVIKNTPDFVMHYNTEYWAEKIYKDQKDSM